MQEAYRFSLSLYSSTPSFPPPFRVSLSPPRLTLFVLQPFNPLALGWPVWGDLESRKPFGKTDTGGSILLNVKFKSRHVAGHGDEVFPGVVGLRLGASTGTQDSKY